MTVGVWSHWPAGAAGTGGLGAARAADHKAEAAACLVSRTLTQVNHGPGRWESLGGKTDSLPTLYLHFHLAENSCSIPHKPP